MHIHDITQPTRYDLWVVPEFPIEIPWVRDRHVRPGEEWRLGLLEDIRKNGMRNHIGVFGHTPRGQVDPRYETEWSAKRSKKYVVCLGTNRLWCLMELGHKTFPAVLSLNVGQTPEFEAYKIPAIDLPNYFTEGKVWVKNYAFGITLAADPKLTYATGTSNTKSAGRHVTIK